MNKQQKKDVWTVVKKYRHQQLKKSREDAIIVHGGGAVLTCAGIVLDLVTTGGLFSMATFVYGGLGFLSSSAMAFDQAMNKKKKIRANTAGQTCKANYNVWNTLSCMQDRLSKSFRAVMGEKDDLQKRAQLKKEFRALAREIQEDAQKLSPAFNIISGTDHQKFIFSVFSATDQKDAHMRLDEALRVIDLPTEKEKETLAAERIKALEDENRALREKSEKDKNSVMQAILRQPDPKRKL